MFEKKLKLGDEVFDLIFPESMSAAVDLWFAVADVQKEESRTADFAKLAAAAIGLGLKRSDGAVSDAPVYDIASRDFILYGNQVIDWVGSKGGRWVNLLNIGSSYLNWCAAELMADEEIVEMEDFTVATEDRLTG